MTPFKFPLPLLLPAYQQSPYREHAQQQHCIRVIGLPCANSALTSCHHDTMTLLLLMDGGGNMCITNDINNLINAKTIALFSLLVAAQSSGASLDNSCTMHGLLALPTTTGKMFYQPCYYCKNATETIILLDAILASNTNLESR
jgi:hypothetical protein